MTTELVIPAVSLEPAELRQLAAVGVRVPQQLESKRLTGSEIARLFRVAPGSLRSALRAEALRRQPRRSQTPSGGER